MSREVPEGWVPTTLGELTQISGGTTPSKEVGEFWEGGHHFWATPTDITALPHGKVELSSTKAMVSDAALHKTSLKMLPVGSVLMTSRATIGYPAINTVPMATNQGFANFHPSAKYDAAFLAYWIVFSRKILKRSAGGSTFPEISKSALKSIPINLPPVHEQRRIAEILSSIDEAIAATRLAIEQTRRVKQSVLERLLTKGIGHTRFKRTEIGEIPEGWGICALAEAATIKHGYPFIGEFFSKEEGPNILLTPGNFSKEKTLYFGPNTKFYQGPIPSDFILKNGDLLVVMTDLTPSMEILGNAVILSSNKTVLHNQRIGKVEVDRNMLSAAFVKHVLNSERVQRQIKNSASGTTVRHTSPSRILENITVLPPMEEQLSIVEALRNIDDGLELQNQNLARISSVKSALMSDLLTGRKRVSDALPLAAE